VPASSSQPSRNESIKHGDPTLGGTIAETIGDASVDRFGGDDEQFLKFHGVYQQDDRDLRKSGRRYQMMVRARLTGGIASPEQYLAFDELSDRFGNGTLRITTRQTFQWHGVLKGNLRPLIHGLNENLCTTLATCGDVNRNVLAPPTPTTDRLASQVQEDAGRVSEALLPATQAYHEIWVEGTRINLSKESGSAFVDPLYGRTYLPRKFKIAVAIPPRNETDVFANCLGFVAIADPADSSRLLGYNVLVGGGMGTTHGNQQTFPRIADALGFVPRERVVDVARAVILAYRDSGDRTNRRHARLKYVIEERGADWFRSEVETRAGFRLEEAREARFSGQGDIFGWHAQGDGRSFLSIFVENGRIADSEDRRLKSGLRGVIERFRPEVRLTAWQNIILAGIADGERDAVTALLAEHRVPVNGQAGAVRRAAMACPALPTCGLAIAESERVSPALIGRIEALLAELGAADEEITVRMTGCPNGCTRPFLAEIGIVGRTAGCYNILLGGSGRSDRLNREYRQGVALEEIIPTLRPVIARWISERTPAERFGDFVARVLWKEGAVPESPLAA
jgi:sulfite reductase (NADPH) hemoprotein beta-component